LDGFDDRPLSPDRPLGDRGYGPFPQQPERAPTPPVIELLPEYVELLRPPRKTTRLGLALTLLGLTFFTTTTLGPAFWAWTRTDLTTDLRPILTFGLIQRVWTDPELLNLGLSFSVPLLLILLAHELGHYIACQYYRLSATLPYFLPIPWTLGTLGAFIRIRSHLRSRKELFDVGIAGPLAGFVVLVPFLVYGLAHSHLAPRPEELRLGETIALPGRSLAIDLLAHLLLGPFGQDTVLNLHPYALAAWFGLLATSINLIPLGQLDGGHILYAVSRRWQRRLAPPVWIALVAAGFLWPGWWIWCLLTFVFRLFHPPVQNEAAPLGRGRQILAAVALAILVLSFTPRGIVILEAVESDAPAGDDGGTWVQLLQKSATSVTGPSLTSATSMEARKRPVSTRKPRLRRSSTRASTSGAASSGGAARSNDGLLPRSTEPASVNWETTRKEPPAAAASRFILPAPSSNTRRPASLPAAART
jgi:Zn-dependent protease